MKSMICLGDSITDADRLFSADGLGYGYVHLLSEKLNRSGPNWRITNRGVDGFTVSRLYENVERDCLRRNPDLVTVLIGINDIALIMNTDRSPAQQEALVLRFRGTYEKLLREIRSRTRAEILLLEPFLLPWPQAYSLWMPFLERFSRIIRELSTTYQTGFLELQTPLLQMAEREGFSACTVDGVHLTGEGHALLAERLFSMIGDTRVKRYEGSSSLLVRD